MAPAISKMSNDAIDQALKSNASPENVLAILNQAFNRGYVDAFYIAANNPNYASNVAIQKLIVNIASQSVNSDLAPLIIDALITNAEFLDPSVIVKIAALAISSTTMFAKVLLNGKTPGNLTNNILNNTHLEATHPDDKIRAFETSIINELQSGTPWNNIYSGQNILARLYRDPNDKLVTEIAKYNLCPEFAESMMNASIYVFKQNKRLQNNISENETPGMEITRLLHDQGVAEVHPNAFLPGLIDTLNNPKYRPYAKWIWRLIQGKAEARQEWARDMFLNEYEGKNIVSILLDIMPAIFPDVLDVFFGPGQNLNDLKNTNLYEEIIHTGLSNPTYRVKTLELPEEAFSMVRMTDENREIVRKHFKPEFNNTLPEEPTDQSYLDDFTLSINNNWYVKYAIAQDILREAGWKENMLSSVMAAIIMILAGSSISVAAQKYNLKEETLQKALQNKELVTQAKELQPIIPPQKTQEYKPKITQPTKKTAPVKENINVAQPSIDEIVNLIIKHEGLLPKQTPFRITSPAMKNWDTILGFKVNKNAVKPKGRENFIFLVNQEDVAKAIKKQFSNYATTPSKYEFESPPTLKDALAKFDHTGVEGKIQFMFDNLSNLKPYIDSPLKSFF